MPNVKIFVEEQLLAQKRSGLKEALGPIRAMLCENLGVPASACQFAVLPVLAMPDLPLVNVELQIMRAPDRTRDRLTGLAVALRAAVADVTGAHVAVRVTLLDPETYLALK